MRADVLVVGAGPAALAVTAECAGRGLRVAGVSSRAPSPWAQTYGAWLDELPDPGLFRRTWAEVRVHARREFALGRTYGLVDNELLFERLLSRAGEVQWWMGEAAEVEHGATSSTVVLRDGRRIEASLVIDASGHRPALVRRAQTAAPAFQMAFGVVGRFDGPPVAPGTMTWMDFRHDFLSDEAFARRPSFLYAMHLDGDRYFVEETSLAARPGVPLAVLARRLEWRLAHQGVMVREAEEIERCAFPMNAEVPEPQRVVGFGAAAGMVHPASGFMVSSALRAAPGLARVVAEGLGDGVAPAEVARSAWDVLWPEPDRARHALHLFGLEALLGMSGPALEAFFASFFALPPADWQSFLSRTGSPRGVSRTMLKVFARCAWSARLPLVAAGARDPGFVVRSLRNAF